MNEEYENVQLDNETDSYIFKFYSKDASRIIPMHLHKEVEILYCIKGNLKIWINGKNLVLSAGEIFFINSSVPHATQSIRDSEVIVLYLSDNVFTKENVLINFVNSSETYRVYIETVQLVEQIYCISEKKERFKKYLQKSLVLKLEYHILKEFSNIIGDKGTKQLIQNEKIGKILDIIQNNFQNNLSLEKLSELSGYSMHYLSRKFHKSTGMTFYEYKKSLCLEMALKMIEATNLSLEEIALKSGFPNEKSMRIYFKKIMGINPQYYRMSKNDRK
ncbi:helix-turn-helix domain-containing protein [Marinilactibacillus psychrotolerans]|uniref:AraC family transcriptional regulator n=1 Tax=Marinilactibacillus psychrotolerans TaxID=191770 RepID=A0AAV3WWA2_9LACT|nr:AraC family transcriptional regulator [Marinilactibacillus psychrotolerans]GEL66878.1 AraC family transcriptional regulator [Marinilactibacillus psychrotolerans]GEQ35964.1 AraC family transcriptional regulator [Marinilactibacillus psychrotolerans]SDC41192.1 Cupin domain-containing protein [Marinilactibacillus psychrotolerans]